MLLPLNLDSLTSLGIMAVNGATFGNFFGKLDATGRATATLTVKPGELAHAVGFDLAFAFVLGDNFSAVSNGEMISIR